MLHTSNFNNLFDVVYENASHLMKLAEDKQYLFQQWKKVNPGYMFGIDGKLTQQEERAEKRMQNLLQRKKKHLHYEGNKLVVIMFN